MSDNKVIIKNVVKKKRDYLVTTNNEDISLDEDTIIKFGVFKDHIFTTAEFENIKNTNLENKAFLKAINYLSYRARSKHEIYQYLQKQELTEIMIENIIEKLSQFGYINDQRFASELVDYESRVKLRGPLYIAQTLQTKGISPELITNALSDYSSELQSENIDAIINKELRTKSKYPPRKQKQLLTQKLLRSGYDSSLVYSQINRLNIVDDSQELLKREFNKLLKKHANTKLTTQELKAKIITNLLNKGYEYSKILELFTNTEYI